MNSKTKRIDPITLEVIRNRLDLIADQMETALLKSAFSSVVKEALDASASIFDNKGRTLAQAAAIPAHLGMLITAAEKVVSVFGKSMNEGDIYIFNDPYDGGTHLPDIALFTPVFFKGELIALSATMAHHQDMGGKSPGSTPPDATEIFAEGLRIPPLRLFDRGQANNTLIEIIKKNVRIPEIVMGDLRAQIAAVTIGKRRLVELVKQYNTEVFNDSINELMDYAERVTRYKIDQMPDGDYEFFDFLDYDGIDEKNPVKIQATVSIKGSEIAFDFSGSSIQAKGALNSVPASTKAAIYCLVKSITDPSLPNNDGCYRPITILLPEGSIVNPKMPAAVSARTITIKRIYDVLLGAMAKAIPDKIHAASSGQLSISYLGGIDPNNGKVYVTIPGMPTAGGMGARPNMDGIDVIDTDVTNLMSQPIEATESEFPLRILKCHLWQDSGGAGKYRGGLGYEFEVELLRGEGVWSHRRDRHNFAPWGLFGGRPAPLCKTYIKRANGDLEEIPSKKICNIKEKDHLIVFTTGGAGYGDPLLRDVKKVSEDVADGKISIESATIDYGVVLGEDLSVDINKTKESRENIRKKNGAINYIFDRGIDYALRTGFPQKHS